MADEYYKKLGELRKAYEKLEKQEELIEEQKETIKSVKELAEYSGDEEAIKAAKDYKKYMTQHIDEVEKKKTKELRNELNDISSEINAIQRARRDELSDIRRAEEKAKTAERIASINEMKRLQQADKYAQVLVEKEAKAYLQNVKELKAASENLRDQSAELVNGARDFFEGLSTGATLESIKDELSVIGEKVQGAVKEALNEANDKIKEEFSVFNDVEAAFKKINNADNSSLDTLKAIGNSFTTLGSALDSLQKNEDIKTKVWKETIADETGKLVEVYHNTTGDDVKLINGQIVLPNGDRIDTDGKVIPNGDTQPEVDLADVALGNGEPNIRLSTTEVAVNNILANAEEINKQYSKNFAGILATAMPSLFTNRFVCWFTTQTGALVNIYNGILKDGKIDHDDFWYLPTIKKINLATAQPAMADFNYGSENFTMSLGNVKDTSTEGKMEVWSSQGLPFYKWVLQCLGKGTSDYSMPGERIVSEVDLPDSTNKEFSNIDAETFVDLHICWVANNSRSTYMKTSYMNPVASYSKNPEHVYDSICHITCKRIKFTGINELKFENGMVGKELAHAVKFTYEKALLTHETIKSKPPVGELDN